MESGATDAGGGGDVCSRPDGGPAWMYLVFGGGLLLGVDDFGMDGRKNHAACLFSEFSMELGVSHLGAIGRGYTGNLLD